MTTYFSVCSGIEAASVAWRDLDWECAGLSEIEPFPRAVLKHHFPEYPLHGDFTALIDDPPDVDVLVSGTPCQDFSIAGLRVGVAGDRGNLTLQFIRLANAIDYLRRDRGKDPCVILWENVPGIFSSKNDFGNVLAGFVGDDRPLEPFGGKWTDAGMVAGPRRRAAWRVLDAQYFGLAQRRERVFIVASAREGFDPAAVLFECEGVRRHSPPRRQAGQGTAAGALRSTDGGGDVDHARAGHLVEVAPTTRGKDGAPSNIAPPLQVEADKGDQDPLVLAFSAKDSGQDATADVAPTLRAMHEIDGNANGGGQVAVAFYPNMGPNARSDGAKEELAGPLAGAGGGNMQAVAFESRFARNGRGGPEEIVPPLKAQSGQTGKGDSAPLVALAMHENQRTEMTLNDTAGSLKVGGGKPSQGNPVVAIGLEDCSNPQSALDDVADPVAANQGRTYTREGTHNLSNVAVTNWMVRRLTPRECERLQGFPDGWTDIPFRGKEHAADGNRYRALGNSMAVPVMSWLGRRIDTALKACRTPETQPEGTGQRRAPKNDGRAHARRRS